MDVDVKCVSSEAFDGEWAIAYSDEEGTAYLIVREDMLCQRVLREAWTAWETRRDLVAA